MGTSFVIGTMYGHNESGYDSVLCVKRTEKSVWMRYEFGQGKTHRMKIRYDKDGNEWTVDTKTPKSYWDLFTIQSKYPEQFAD